MPAPEWGKTNWIKELKRSRKENKRAPDVTFSRGATQFRIKFIRSWRNVLGSESSLGWNGWLTVQNVQRFLLFEVFCDILGRIRYENLVSHKAIRVKLPLYKDNKADSLSVNPFKAFLVSRNLSFICQFATSCVTKAFQLSLLHRHHRGFADLSATVHAN